MSTITFAIGNDDVAEGDGALRQCIILCFTKSVGSSDATSSTKSSAIVPSAHSGWARTPVGPLIIYLKIVFYIICFLVF